MKKKHRKAFGEYVRWIADEMGLRDWHFELVFKSPEPHPNKTSDAMMRIASCEVTPGRRNAVLTFDPEIHDRDKKDLRNTVVHELTHCHLGPLWDQICRDLLGDLGQSAYDLFTASAERNLEHAIDAMSTALAEHMPLIDWDQTDSQ